ncbi:uncharacterized protein CMC5_005630 [Chondromyces crocatus]|uniref:Uncharacterized protein n=1 Tax=Chondromyces crocatus TaxID=52 RepID=A0A0K1E6E8_CHOCO|nr:uncharacterized protein CMC5_005630 [Chondromyces crocatus]
MTWVQVRTIPKAGRRVKERAVRGAAWMAPEAAGEWAAPAAKVAQVAKVALAVTLALVVKAAATVALVVKATRSAPAERSEGGRSQPRLPVRWRYPCARYSSLSPALCS